MEQENEKAYVIDLSLIIQKDVGLDYPEEVHFGGSVVNKEVIRKIIIRSLDNKGFHIEKAESSTEGFRVINFSQGVLGTHHWVEIAFQPRCIGSYSGEVTLTTTHPHSSTLRLTVDGTCY